MSIRFWLNPVLRPAGLAALLLLIAMPALAGEIYSWRTEDGTTAFTDDPKAIPARYRDQVAVREGEGIQEYSRFTGPKAGAPSDYSERLEARLEHLRALNGDLTAAAAPPRPGPAPSVAVNTGDLTIGMPNDAANAGPVVVESFRYQYWGEQGTRHNTVISRGGDVMTVLKGERHIGGISQAPDNLEMLD